ncbi:MAG TPA: epoxyqueuosine reductase [Armatimonadetes bacterium]|nr:epoxyqueuosine reductase [Armatimonadota bacterium]
MLRKEELKEFAFSRGLDLVGVANIERFKGAPPRMHPANIFPEARSVIVVARRIPRGTLRGIEEGTNWVSYTYFGYHGLHNTFFWPLPTYELACFIEDRGWEAVPYYPGVPEAQPPREPLREGTVAPEVQMQMRIAAVAAGLGEIGWSKVLLTEQFGPRQRLGMVITDAPLEPDPIVEPGSICHRCMVCVQECPAQAIPHLSEGKVVEVEIAGYRIQWADVDMGKCCLSYHGLDKRVSPFLAKECPGFVFEVRQQKCAEEEAYKLCWPLSTGAWRKSEKFPSGYIVEGHARLQQWGVGGSYGVCGARGCIRSCLDHLERLGRLGQTFHTGPFIKRPRWLLDLEGNPSKGLRSRR